MAWLEKSRQEIGLSFDSNRKVVGKLVKSETVPSKKETVTAKDIIKVAQHLIYRKRVSGFEVVRGLS